MQHLRLSLKEAFLKRDVGKVTRILWYGYIGTDPSQCEVILSPLQKVLMRKIGWEESRRLQCSCMTRWGKSFSIAGGANIYILRNHNKKVALIGPEAKQADILRRNMATLILKSPIILQMADMDSKGVDRLRKEASKKRQTFKNGCEFEVFTASGEADRLMGFGGNLIIEDEACLIGEAASSKIIRMLGDDPEKSMHVQLFNPWDMSNRAYTNHTSGKYEFFHVDWRKAIEDGRTTLAHINEMRGIVTPLEFTIFYDSEFPEQSEDSVFSLAWIKTAQSKGPTLSKEIEEIMKELESLDPQREESIALKEKLETYEFIIAIDPADKGMDWTVIYWGWKCGDTYEVIGVYSEATSDNMKLAKQIYTIYQQYSKGLSGTVNYDGHGGYSAGIISRLEELQKENNDENLTLKKCLFGSPPLNERIYPNLKSENYWRLREILRTGQISLDIEEQKTKTELMSMKWEYASGSTKIKIIDPEKSPDYADALVYFIWRDKIRFGYAF